MTGDWDLPPQRSGFVADDALKESRARLSTSAPQNARFTPAEIGGSACLLVEPQAGPGRADILYIHGGGYRLGSPIAYLAFAQTLADRSGRRIVLPTYPLAPEHPFPAAPRALAHVFRALPDPEGTVIAGDSAGGGLTAALSILGARAGLRPAGAMLISPMLDLDARGESLERNALRDPIFTKAMVLNSATLYLQGHPSDDPLVSPLHADPADFPPTLVLTGSAETLLDEALDFVRKLALADRPVRLHVAPAMGHVWPIMAPHSPEADAAMDAMAAFAKSLECASNAPSA